MTVRTVFPEGSPWDWGDLSPSEVLELSALTRDEDGPCGLLFQYAATRNVLALRPAIEAGSGFDVLEAVGECARCGLVIPDWLAEAFLKRYRAVSQARAKSWDDPQAFGAPYPKSTNVNAVRKARIIGVRLYSEASRLMNYPPHLSQTDALAQVGEKLGVAKTLAEQYFRMHRERIEALGGVSLERSQPAKYKKAAGRQRPPR